MAKIKLITRGKTVPSPLYLRFTKGRALDVFAKTGLLVDPNQWDNKSGNYKNSKEVKNRLEWNAKFDRLKLSLLEAYNEAYMQGEVINRDWLETSLQELLNRPKQEVRGKIKEHFIYYIEFVEYWLENEAPTWKTGKNKYLSERAIKQYRSFLAIWTKFSKGKRYRLSDIDSVLISKFVDFSQDEQGYSAITIKRWVGRLKFFLNRADNMELKVNPDFKERVYVGKEEEITKPYLKETEIDSIFELDLKHDHELDSCRDYLVISCYTGLRVGDLLHNLDTSNIKDGYIEIKTQKTGSFVKIPIHPKVKYIIDKRFGNLPEKIHEPVYNIKIKHICKLAGITEMMYGKKFDSETKRGIIGNYPKYKLITSHVGRRSMATLLAGKLPKEAIAALGGWSNTDMPEFYNKTTKTDYANMLANFWKQENE